MEYGNKGQGESRRHCRYLDFHCIAVIGRVRLWIEVASIRPHLESDISIRFAARRIHIL